MNEQFIQEVFPMADQRLKAVCEAAGFLFVKKGYANTQVAEIAERANIGTGTVYNLFSGKKAILHFVIMSTFRKDYLEGEITLPIREVDEDILLNELNTIADKLLSQLELKIEEGPALSFSEMISTLIDYAADYQVAFNIINDQGKIFKNLGNMYENSVSRLYGIIKENLQEYINRGEVRQIEHSNLHVGNILDTVVWWSMDIPYAAPGAKLTREEIKKIAMDVLNHAYLNSPK